MSATRTGPAGERLFVRLGGRSDPAAPLLLCLHGFTGSGRTWRPFARRFGRRFRLVCPDAMGHGRSDAPERRGAYDLWHTADLLEGLLQRLDPRPAHVLGYSMGGRQALHLALRHPERVASLVLEGASPGIEEAEERERRRADDGALASLLRTEGIEAFVRRWESVPLFATQAGLRPDRFAAQRRERLSQRPRGLAASLDGAGAGAQDNLWPRLPEIAAPVLFVAGALDRRYAAVGRRVAGAVHDGRMVEIDGAGHSAHLERPGAFAHAVESFWREAAPGPPA